MKEFADDNFKFYENDGKCSQMVENTVAKGKLLVMSNISFSHSFFKRLVLQTGENQALFGKGLTHYHTMLHFDALKIHRCENIVRKGEIACNNVFHPIWHLLFILNAL